MADFTVIAVSASKGAEEAELYVVASDFSVEAEAVGYARRMAEESYQLAGQLDLDFDESHVSVYVGDVDVDAVDADHASFVGMWFFTDDGVDWASAEALREAGEDAPDEDVA
jgi:hypothetical protein